MLDPLAARDLRSASRRWTTYGVRAAYLACAAALLYGTWRSEARSGLFLTNSAYADLGRRLFRAVFWIQFGFVALAAAFAAAEGVLRDLRNGALSLLVLTPLTEAGIVRSKWAAALAQAGLLLLAGAPVLAVCVFLGGAEPVELLASLGLSLAMAALAAAVAVRAATLRRSVAAALATTLLEIGASALVPLFAALFTAGLAAFAALFLHPLYAAAGLRLVPYLQRIAELAWPVALLATAFWVRLLLRSAARHLAVRLRENPEPPVDPATELPWPLLVRPPVSDRHPLLWKEKALRGAARLLPETRILALFALYFAVYVVMVASQGRFLGGLQVFGALAGGAAALLGALLFQPWVELDPLLSAPLPNAAFVRAKLLAGLLAPEALAAAPALLLGLLVFAHRSGPAGLLLFFASALLLLGLLYLLGALASVHARSLLGALTGSAAAALAVAALAPFDLFEALLLPPGEIALPPDALPRAWNRFRVLAPATAVAAALAYLGILRRFAGRAGRR